MMIIFEQSVHVNKSVGNCGLQELPVCFRYILPHPGTAASPEEG